MTPLEIDDRLDFLRRHRAAGSLSKIDFTSADLMLALNRLHALEQAIDAFFDAIEQCNQNLFSAGLIQKTSRHLFRLLGRHLPKR